MKWRIALLSAACALLLGTARAADEGAKPAEATKSAEAPKPVSDRDLSLYPGSVFEVPNPPGFKPNTADPGDNARLARANAAAPPRIPHGVEDFLPITLQANTCLDCHALDAGFGAPELPASHRTDLRRAPEKVEKAAAGARWQCLACHVPTSDAKPLRANSAAPR
jgi:cytochrome c-type protein NapB